MPGAKIEAGLMINFGLSKLPRMAKVTPIKPSPSLPPRTAPKSGNFWKIELRPNKGIYVPLKSY